jgi:hypothetical protein
MIFKCKDIGYLASDYLAGDMTLPERLKLRLHISICTNCQRFMRQMTLLNKTLPQYRFIEPDDAQVDAWMNGLPKV